MSMINFDSDSIRQALSSRACKIAYLGNSVTAQKNGYKTYLHKLICEITKHEHIAINAGIGGVGSLASAFLLSDFVLRQKPDLCFIECAIADSEHATPRELIKPSIDSILWQLSKAHIPTCMLYLYKDKQAEYYRQILQEEYTPVVNHYSTAVIDIYPQIMGMISSQRLRPQDILTDGIHTTEFGASLSAKITLEQLLKLMIAPNIPTTRPWRSNSFLYPQILKLQDIAIDSNSSISFGKYKLIIPYLELGHGSSLSLTVGDGEILGAIMVADKYSGVIEIASDKFHHAAQIHDEWCEKPRLQVAILPKPIKACERFTIKISQNNIAHFGANLQTHAWSHLGVNLKIIGLLVNRSEALPKPIYLW